MTRNSVPQATAAPNPAALLFFPVIMLMLILAWPGIADAKRIGGGGSFGSKPSYSSGYTKPTSQPRDTSTMQKQAMPAGQSRFGGLGGMFGGLLMGGLIGSMLFGGGFAGPGLLDMLLLGTAAFMLFRFLRSRRTATATGTPYASADGGSQREFSGGWGNAGFGPPAAPTRPSMPAGVDEQEFLAGAKALYTRLQASWDARDLEDIRRFTSDEVFTEIARQAGEDGSPGRTEILVIEARVLEARTLGTETVVSVLFDAMLREGGAAARADQVREVWHVRRDETDPAPQWILEGIQQLEM